MRIDWLHIKDFKNLRDFTIDLAEKEAMSVLIGENGSGKSNLFEAIVHVFRSLDLGEAAPFGYEIRYVCRQHKVSIEYDPLAAATGGYVAIFVDDARVEWPAFKRRRAELLPEHVFAYYSGPGTRLDHLFRRHLADFEKAVRKQKVSTGRLRRLFYCLPKHSRLVLLSYFIDPKTDKNFLKEYFGIEAFDSALIVLKKPWWGDRKPSATGDARFWWAEGDVARFLNSLWSKSLAPMRISEGVENVDASEERRHREEERRYLYLQDDGHLQDLAAAWASPKEFFAALEAVDVADLISDVRVRVRCTGGTMVTFSELSEGEQQLLAVVGMLRFTQGEETLFLLDEPDTHLNPRWKLDYLELLEREVGGVKGSSQLILSTHDPLTIAALKKNQVQIFRRHKDSRVVRVDEAPDDPRGLGVVGVLTMMFGLTRTLDRPTLKMMEERDVLAALKERDEDQAKELLRLNSDLARLGFMSESRDPRVNKVLAEVAAWEQQSDKMFWDLTEPEQRALAEELVKRVLGEPNARGVF